MSVVVAVHGVAAELPACLDSLVAGTHPDVEIIAVDDASPDGAGEILDAYAERDPRLRVVHLSTNVGLGAARNVGLDRATGAYVWFVDGDDELAPGALARVLGRLAARAPDVLVLGHARLGPDGVARADESAPGHGQVPVPPALDCADSQPATLRELPGLLRVRQAAWNRVVSRALLARTGLRFPDGWYEDVAFSQLVLVAADRIAVLDDVCYLYRDRAFGSITRTPSPRHFDVFLQYERMFSTLDGWPGGAGMRLRARLFERMVEHYLVIAGAPDRVPAPLRRAFFARMVAHYARYRPVGGYPVPAGFAGLRHRLVRLRAYRMLAAARAVRHPRSWGVFAGHRGVG